MACGLQRVCQGLPAETRPTLLQLPLPLKSSSGQVVGTALLHIEGPVAFACPLGNYQAIGAGERACQASSLTVSHDPACHATSAQAELERMHSACMQAAAAG